MSRSDQYDTRHTLLARLRDSGGDQASWDEFVRLYRNYVYALARGMQLSHHDSEDVLQAVLLKVWKKLPDFEHEGGAGKFRSWLKTTTRNTVLNLIDKRKRESKRMDDIEATEGVAYLAGIRISEIDEIAEREWRTVISNMAWQNVKGDLSETQQAIVDRSLSGESVAEISVALALPPNSVSVNKRRAFARLKKEIAWLNGQLS